MCWSMTNRAIGLRVMWSFRKGQIKWTRHPFVKESSGYLGFLNEISSSLLFSKSLTVGWRDSHPHQVPSERNWLSFDGESGSWDRIKAWTESKKQSNNKPLRFTTSPTLYLRLRAMCVFLYEYVCFKKKTKHTGNQAVYQTSLSYVPQSIAVQ